MTFFQFYVNDSEQLMKFILRNSFKYKNSVPDSKEPKIVLGKLTKYPQQSNFTIQMISIRLYVYVYI